MDIAKKPSGPKRVTTSDLIEDLTARLGALLDRACEPPARNDPVPIEDMLSLYEVSARLEVLIETLDERRRLRSS